MAHSCIPNASVVVIKDRMLIHSNADGEGGQRVTFNKISRWVLVGQHAVLRGRIVRV